MDNLIRFRSAGQFWDVANLNEIILQIAAVNICLIEDLKVNNVFYVLVRRVLIIQ